MRYFEPTTTAMRLNHSVLWIGIAAACLAVGCSSSEGDDQPVADAGPAPIDGTSYPDATDVADNKLNTTSNDIFGVLIYFLLATAIYLDGAALI